jgi:hypothetical protein
MKGRQQALSLKYKDFMLKNPAMKEKLQQRREQRKERMQEHLQERKGQMQENRQEKLQERKEQLRENLRDRIEGKRDLRQQQQQRWRKQ